MVEWENRKDVHGSDARGISTWSTDTSRRSAWSPSRSSSRRDAVRVWAELPLTGFRLIGCEARFLHGKWSGDSQTLLTREMLMNDETVSEAPATGSTGYARNSRGSIRGGRGRWSGSNAAPSTA